MITVIVPDCNNFSQDFYNSVVDSLQVHQLTCSCGHSACLHIHAYYKRDVHSSSGCHTLRIQRLKCSECGRTHAILPSSIVPYQQVSLEDQRITVQAFEGQGDTRQACTPSGSIDENNVKSILRRYRKHWREKLRSEGIPPCRMGRPGPGLLCVLFCPVHADSPLTEHPFPKYHMSLPDRSPFSGYDRGKSRKGGPATWIRTNVRISH